MIRIEFWGQLKELVKYDAKKIIKQSKQKIVFDYPITRRASIKDIIEALGVPHTEVGEIKNGQKKIDFKYIVSSKAKISVFPHEIPLNPNNYLFEEPIEEYKFITDVNVGKLTKYIRLLGFDCAYHWTWDDDKIADIAYSEKRILLTKDVQLLKRKKVLWGKLVKSSNPIEQLQEIVTFFGLKIAKDTNKILSRCLICNEKLLEVSKQEVIHRLAPKTKKYFNKFSLCPKCNKIYWAGSHVDKMKNILNSLKIFIK